MAVRNQRNSWPAVEPFSSSGNWFRGSARASRIPYDDDECRHVGQSSVIYHMVHDANPVNGQTPKPAYRRKKKKSKPELADTEEKDAQPEKCRWCRFRGMFFPWRKPCDRICVPPTEYQPDRFAGYSVDRREWEVVQGNFSGPLNQYYAPDDPDKPEVYMYMVPGETQGLAPVPQITEIDRKVKAIMDAKQERDPDLQMRFTMAQMGGALHAAGLSAIPYIDGQGISATHTDGQVQISRRTEPAEDEWLCDLDKVFVLRERLSPLSLLSPPPTI
ncbi:hypothetical protein F5144DRAFT_549328 [Chaetomium tenue]|uniref:Uncharacterized protein n=1 Tax=Chaetomium tenue TaxID=1854479 RepID=A0ACB7P419_9PEZI|nr:hypothetical protein F5144DRAFT_549328 [Chaetomium globosum]